MSKRKKRITFEDVATGIARSFVLRNYEEGKIIAIPSAGIRISIEEGITFVDKR